MINRRDMLKSGVAIAGASLLGTTSAMARTLSDSGKSPVSLYTDEAVSALGISQHSHGALNQAIGMPNITCEEVLGESMLSSFKRVTEWLESRRGTTTILVIDSRHGFIVDETIRETHSRILFQGSHSAMAMEQGPVSHTGIELPVSAGVIDKLPTNGAWTEKLLSSLALVATRQWSEHAASPRFTTHTIRPAAAKLSLATYVIEI